MHQHPNLHGLSQTLWHSSPSLCMTWTSPPTLTNKPWESVGLTATHPTIPNGPHAPVDAANNATTHVIAVGERDTAANPVTANRPPVGRTTHASTARSSSVVLHTLTPHRRTVSETQSSRFSGLAQCAMRWSSRMYHATNLKVIRRMNDRQGDWRHG